MTVVSVSELKAHLSRYLRVVRRGGEVQILDRGTPVARLVGLPSARAGQDDDQRQRLVAGGIVRAGDGRTSQVLDEPPVDLPTSLASALEEDRADRQ